jgi:hypothetical protein
LATTNQHSDGERETRFALLPAPITSRQETKKHHKYCIKEILVSISFENSMPSETSFGASFACIKALSLLIIS